jgi:biotin carboxyl carrier protein
VKFWVTSEDHDTEVDFHTEGDRVFVKIEGRTLEADFRHLPDGEVYSLLIEGRSHEMRISPAGNGVIDVTVAGTVMPVEVRHPLEKLLQSVRPGGAATQDETVSAPMPGLVVTVRVKPGDAVVAGQPVIVVEAMKMQNELAARGPGVVREVLVAERASVAAGQPLIRIGPT